jgi:ATP-binding cassette subfamily B protein
MPDTFLTRSAAPPRDASNASPLPPPAAIKPFPFIWHYARTHGGPRLFVVVLLALAGAVVDNLQPYALGALVNALAAVSGAQLPTHDVMGGGAGQATLWFVVLCAIWIVGPVLSRVHTYVTTTNMLAMRSSIQDHLFLYAHGHAPRFFLDQFSGAVSTKVRSAASAASVVIDFFFSTAPRLVVLFILSALLVTREAPQFLLLFAGFAVVFAVVAGVLAQHSRKYAKASSRAGTVYTGRLVDSLNNWDLVRAFARRSFERAMLAPLNRKEYDTGVELRLVLFRMRLILHAVSVAFLIVVVWWGFKQALAGEVSVGTFTMLMSLSLLISANVNMLGDNLLGFFENLGVLTEALETVTLPHEIVDAPGALPLATKGGAIDVRNVRFDYPDGTPVFENLNLTIAAGEKVGLVGPSGAGKSTLLRIVRRQFTLKEGGILVDGQDIADVTWDSLHEAFAEVPQAPSVFHRTVRDNILYGRPSASEAEMIAAAKLAHCHDFVVARPGGYDAVVGEKGMKLSGGERQRVAIARAFLKDAPILILDEATSSLDSEAEHLIQDGLLKLMEGRTVIAIAHRLSTIMHLEAHVRLAQPQPVLHETRDLSAHGRA